MTGTYENGTRGRAGGREKRRGEKKGKRRRRRRGEKKKKPQAMQRQLVERGTKPRKRVFA